MKTNAQVLRDVQDRLGREPSIRDHEIGVAAKDGVVTLSGHVPSFADKYIAIDVAERVEGVDAVADEMEVKLPSSHARTDTELAHAAVRALKCAAKVPHDQVKVTVRDGWISLQGEVEWQHQREAAERALRDLTGMRGLTNLIAVPAR